MIYCAHFTGEERDKFFKVTQLIRRKDIFQHKFADLLLLTTVALVLKGKSHLAATSKSDFSHCEPGSHLFGVMPLSLPSPLPPPTSLPFLLAQNGFLEIQIDL